MAQAQWYMAIGGHQVGPVTQQEIITNLQNGSIDAETLVFSAGMTQWQKVKDVPAFAAYVKDEIAKWKRVIEIANIPKI